MLRTQRRHQQILEMLRKASDVKGEEGIKNGRTWCTGSLVLRCRGRPGCPWMRSLLHVLSVTRLCGSRVEMPSSV